MTQTMTRERACDTRHLRDHPFGGEPCRSGGKAALRLRKPLKSAGTPGGQKLGEKLKIAKLQREVGQLTKLVNDLIALIDPEEVAAAHRLRVMSPTNAQLRVWAAGCEPPPESAILED